MSSGIKVNQECLDLFNDFKLKKSLKYIVYKISDDLTQIEVEKKGAEADYDTFISTLPENDSRFAVYDFEYDTEDAGKRNKICFYIWAPDTAKIKSKMLYASSKDALRKALQGISVDIQGTDFSEISYDLVLAKVSQGRY